MKCEAEIHINTTHFNERLTTKGLTLFDVYTHLYPEKASVCKTSTDRNFAIRKIRNWQDGFSMPKTINELLSLCELFDCDVEYIIGKQRHFRNDSLDAIERTGLDEITIEELSKLSTTEKHIVNALFSRTIGSFNLLKLIKEMLFYSHPNAQNNAHISLDSEITSKSKDMEELEKKLNDTEILNLLSYKLSLEMQNIIECLTNDKDLTNEIYAEYKKLYFRKHIKLLSASDLPKLTTDESGMPVIDTEWQIEKLETQILERLTTREKMGNYFVYNIDWLHSSSDFREKMQDLRTTLDANAYLEWLEDIENNTK